MEIAIIFAFLAMLFWGLEGFFGQKVARKIGDFEALAFISIIGAIVMTPFIIKDFNLLTKENIIILLIVALVHFIAALFYFESLKQGKLSVMDVIFELELPITIGLGIIFFAESLNFLQMAMIGLIFLGIILIAIKSFKHLKTKFERGAFFALITAILFAFVNFSSAFSARTISPLFAIWGVWIFMAIFSLVYLFYKNKGYKFIKDGLRIKWDVLSLAVVATLAWIFYFFAVSKEGISIITAITEAYPAISVCLGLWINKEKINWHQYVGIGLAIIAAIILAISL